jgi:hypothetical protein
MGGLKGENIFTASYIVINGFEEVRGHSLTQTKSLQVAKGMYEGRKIHPPKSSTRTRPKVCSPGF